MNYPKLRVAGRWGMVWRKEFIGSSCLEGINVWDRLEFVDRCPLNFHSSLRPATAQVRSSVPYGWSRIEGGAK